MVGSGTPCDWQFLGLILCSTQNGSRYIAALVIGGTDMLGWRSVLITVAAMVGGLIGFFRS